MTRKPKACTPQATSHAVAATRRRFLKAASGVAGGAALAFPMISKGQASPISMRFQSTWPTKDIFHEYAQDYAKTVNDMGIQVLALVLLYVFPGIGLWLPHVLYK